MAEVGRLPVGLLEAIIDDRVIARAIATYQQNPKATGDLIDIVKQVEFEEVQAQIDGQ